MSNILQNARLSGLRQQEAYHKRQAEKVPKDRRRSRIHRRKKK